MSDIFSLKARVAAFGLVVAGGYVIMGSAGVMAQNNPAPSVKTEVGKHLSAGTQLKDNVSMRVKRQLKHIQAGVDAGKLTEEQADKLRVLVTQLGNDAKAMRDQNGGTLKPEQLTQIQSSLNQTANQVETALGAGTKLPEDASALGPKWKAGPDGAQDPKSLLKQMKAQEKRALRQQRQANMQILEQQQLDYEKQVVNQLGQQRPAIQEKKQELQDVRQQAGAN